VCYFKQEEKKRKRRRGKEEGKRRMKERKRSKKPLVPASGPQSRSEQSQAVLFATAPSTVPLSLGSAPPRT